MQTIHNSSTYDTKTVQINWNSSLEIEAAEEEKFILESEGYELIDTIKGLFNSVLVYRKKVDRDFVPQHFERSTGKQPSSIIY